MRHKAPKDDRSLLAASRRGDGGFDEFYRRYRDLILAYHRRRVTDPELAADLTAETFAAALVGLQNGVPDAPGPWLFTIAQRKLIDSYRHRQVEDAARRRLQLEPLAIDDDDLELIEQTVSATDPASELARHLPSGQWEALRARVLDEREYADIATELRCSQSVVRMRVSRALQTLRASLEQTDD